MAPSQKVLRTECQDMADKRASVSQSNKPARDNLLSRVGQVDPPDGVYSSVIEAIGNTPMVALDRLTEGIEGRVFAKLEYLNPGFSKKDRTALWMLREATRAGDLESGQTVVELTSGNTGTGLAIACRALGHPFVAVMSRGNSAERARMMAALGAEVVLVDQARTSEPGQVSGEDLALVEVRTRKICRERGGFRADQFTLPSIVAVHRDKTAQEILRQTEGDFDAFCDFVGSGGSFAGCATAFREYRADIRCYLVEPAGAAVISGEELVKPRHVIQGGGYSRDDLPALRGVKIDGCLTVTDDDAAQMTRRLAAEEGIFAGYSSGANVAAALQLLKGAHAGGTFVVLICDSGLKYLSTDLWTALSE